MNRVHVLPGYVQLTVILPRGPSGASAVELVVSVFKLASDHASIPRRPMEAATARDQEMRRSSAKLNLVPLGCMRMAYKLMTPNYPISTSTDITAGELIFVE